MSVFKVYQNHKMTINSLNKLWIAQLSFKSFLIIPIKDVISHGENAALKSLQKNTLIIYQVSKI